METTGSACIPDGDPEKADARFRWYRPDLGGDFFSLMREDRGFVYEDALASASAAPAEASVPGESGVLVSPAPFAPAPAAPACAPAPAPAASGAVRSLFWPGCSLSSFSRELTEAVCAHLKESGAVDAMSIRCCGSIIRYAGGPAPFAAYRDDLVATLRARGIRRIVTSCPNCYQVLRRALCEGQEGQALRGMQEGSEEQEEREGQALSGMQEGPKAREGQSGQKGQEDALFEVVSLSQVLVNEGLHILPEQAASAISVCVHDSCPDRASGVEAAAVRCLFEGIELREMRHNRHRSHCCGSGRLQFLSDPVGSDRQRVERLAEFEETGAARLVTSCFSCANALQLPGGTAHEPTVHYLELVFGIPIDWRAVYASSARIQSSLDSP
jgi:Fe-S oxidoreductase